MARVPKPGLRAMTAAEQATLRRLHAAGSERVDHVRRATALLAVAQGHSFAHAARQAGFHSASTVTGLVLRFNAQGLEALHSGAGRGRKPVYDAAARAPIVATAPRPPDRTRDGTATWSLSTLERTLRRGALPAVGATPLRRVRQDAGSAWQTTRTWCPTGTAQRKRQRGGVTATDPRTAEKRG